MTESDPPTNTPPKEPRPYEIEPVPVAPATTGSPRPTKVGDAGLLDDFDEDADFDRDPELEKAKRGPTPPAAAPPESALPDFVKPGWGEAQPVALIASGVLLAGVIAASVTTKQSWFAAGASAAYSALLHTVTGATAVAVAAHFTQSRIGSLPLALARMFMAVSVFTLIFHLNIPISGPADEVILAIASYVGVVWALFRLSSERLFILVSIHAGLWLIIYLSAVLHTWAAASGSPTPPTP